MATVDENLRVWNDDYKWPSAGDEWSADFGGTEALWFFVLYPRLHRFIPAGTILEIAPGFGRWTQFLKAQCQRMIAVDLSEKCVEHCRTRFASDKHLTFHVNDGTSLAAVPDNSIDFVFSFDSLVHAEKDVMQAYVAEFARKLTPQGVGFIHHSNIGAYRNRLRLHNYYNGLPARPLRGILTPDRVSALLSINLQAGRARSMTADLFRDYCRQAQLKCVRQETMNWGKEKGLTDAISVFTRPNSSWDTGETFLRNTSFLDNAALTSRLSQLYCS